jgi:hypothetical protein
MKTIFTFVLMLSVIAASQENHKIRIALTPRSNVSTSEVGKELDRHCPSVVVSDDAQKATYALEAWDTGAGAGRKPYKFTLFQNGDRVFSTETRGVAGAVKDVCTYIEKH